MDSIHSLYAKFLECSEVTTDTRKLKEGCLFLALKGDNFNGNEFAEEALSKGAKYAVVDEKAHHHPGHTFLVEDVLTSLQQLANHHRKQFQIPFLGITGSNGKTTTKELIRDVLLKKYKALATRGNLNNHIGVPLTLLELKPEHEFAIIEMGANHQGEIEQLSKIAEPDYGMITNIGKAHIEGFGGVEGIKKGKSELYRHIESRNGLIFINGDDSVLQELLKGYQKVYTYGKENCDVNVRLLASKPFLNLEWIQGESVKDFSMKIYGSYNYGNAAAAIAIGHYFGVDSDDIIEALSSYESSNNRSQLIVTDRRQLFLDAYNANPSSMALAIKSFIETDSERKAVILGDMLELGEDTDKEHQAIIDLLRNEFKGEVFLVGKFFKRSAGTVYHSFEGVQELLTYFKENGLKAQSVLIKGSRRIGLEKVVDSIT